MNAKEAAEKLFNWALATGLMHSDHISPADVAALDTDDMFPASAVEILRKRTIRHIAFNDQRNEVIVILQRSLPVSKKIQNALPQEIGGVAIKFRQGVTQTIGHQMAIPHAAPPWTLRQCANGQGRYACGSSISVGNNREAGTLGSLVKDTTGTLYGLSNNHVSGSCNYAARGLPILAPGVLDVCAGGLPPFTIGHHTKLLQLYPGSPDHVPAGGNLDAAIFEISNSDNVTSWQGNSYDTPSQVGALVGGIDVEKVGRTTGSTRGRVVGEMLGYHGIMYNAPLYQFAGPVYFRQMFAILGYGDAFSDSGDSGSLITTVSENGERKAVGIVVGGMDDSQAPGGKLSLALPIEPILTGLGVELVSGLNV